VGRSVATTSFNTIGVVEKGISCRIGACFNCFPRIWTKRNFVAAIAIHDRRHLVGKKYARDIKKTKEKETEPAARGLQSAASSADRHNQRVIDKSHVFVV
jgi:hypothetical protein